MLHRVIKIKKKSFKSIKSLKIFGFTNKKNYNKYKKWCDKIFLSSHRKEPRGIGGIFFDYETRNWEENFKFVRDLGIGF